MKKPVLLILILFISGVSGISAQQSVSKAQTPAKKKTAKIQYGLASYYHNKFQGRKTASGEKFDQKKMTAAHNGLPLHTWIRVTNMYNGRSVVVKVNDRLHPKNKRLIDLTRVAATKLGYVNKGLTKVKVEVLGTTKPQDVSAHK